MTRIEPAVAQIRAAAAHADGDRRTAPEDGRARQAADGGSAGAGGMTHPVLRTLLLALAVVLGLVGTALVALAALNGEPGFLIGAFGCFFGVYVAVRPNGSQARAKDPVFATDFMNEVRRKTIADFEDRAYGHNRFD